MDTYRLYKQLQGSLSDEAARNIADAMGSLYAELHDALTKDDLSEVRQSLHDLTEAQQQTEQRLGELAAAQQRTETRLEQFGAAQQQTEQRLGELAAAQQRTETRFGSLTTAVEALAQDQRQVRKTLGGLSDSVGYGLEDRAIARLPELLANDYAIAVSGRLARRFVEYPDGGSDELNIIGEGARAEQGISILGEAKAQLGKRDVDRFLRVIDRLDQHGQLRTERFLFAVSYSTQPDVERYALQHGVVVIPSYLLAG